MAVRFGGLDLFWHYNLRGEGRREYQKELYRASHHAQSCAYYMSPPINLSITLEK